MCVLAISILEAISNTLSKVSFVAVFDSRRLCMLSSFIPHTIRSRRRSFKDAKLQYFARRLSSATKLVTDFPCLLVRVSNMNLSTILLCCVSKRSERTFTSSSYDLSVSLSGVTKPVSNEYVVGPMQESR